MGAVIRVGWGWGLGVVIASSTLVVGYPGGCCHRGGRIVNAGGVVGCHGCHCIVDAGDGVVVVGGGSSTRVVVMVVVVTSSTQVVMVVVSSM